MDLVVTVFVCVALCVPAAAVFIAAKIWRNKLRQPGLFIAIGLIVSYALTTYLITRPIATHAVGVGTIADAEAVQEEQIAAMRKMVMLMFCEVCAGSALIVAVLRRVFAR